MSTLDVLACAVLLASGAAMAAGPDLGTPISAADLAAWDTSIMPDGAGLPSGSGAAAQGAAIYATKCAACHGEEGKGGISSAVTARAPISSINSAEKTIGNFWPYATTLFDYVRRAMPYPAPHSLTDPEVYALVAYLLNLNGVIGKDAVMDARTLPRVEMPNRANFERAYPPPRR